MIPDFTLFVNEKFVSDCIFMLYIKGLALCHHRSIESENKNFLFTHSLGNKAFIAYDRKGYNHPRPGFGKYNTALRDDDDIHSAQYR